MKRLSCVLIVALISLVCAHGVAGAAPSDSWDENDFSPVDGAVPFGISLTRDWNGDNCRWTVNMGGISGHWSTGFQVMIADGSSPMFLLGWSPGESTLYDPPAPIYKEYNGGWGAATTTLPDGMSVSGAYNETDYVIQVPKSYLGSSFGWGTMVEATWEGSGSSSSQQHVFPSDWVRWTATNTYSDSAPAEGGGCFIATAACGPDDGNVETLRSFRDRRLATDSLGSGFIYTYYRFSPPVAEFIDDHPALKPMVRTALLPAVGVSEAAGVGLGVKVAIASWLLILSGVVLLVVDQRRRENT